MRWSEAELRQAHGALSLGPGASPCPDDEVLQGFLLGELDDEARGRLADHVEDCSRCASFLQEMGALADWARRAEAAEEPNATATFVDSTVVPLAAGRRREAREDPPAVVSASRPALSTGNWRRWGSLAAALVVGSVGLAWWLGQVSVPSEPDLLRGRNGSRFEEQIPADGASLAGMPTVFDWPDQAGTEGYLLEVYGPGGDLLWQFSELAASEAQVPPELLASASRGVYSWTVEVEGPVQRRELGPYTFRIEPR